MRPAATPTDDSPRPLVLLAGCLVATIALCATVPLVGFLVLTLLVYAGAALLAYVLVRMVLKFLRENLGESGILTAWRPGVFGGLRVAAVVLLLWAPFGVASVAVFGANGLVVHLLGELTVSTIDGVQADLGEREGDFAGWEEGVRSGLRFLPLPGKDTLRDAVDGVRPGLRSVRGALVNLLQLVRFALVVESYFAWIFLMWLTVRSVLYFLARTVLADHLRALPPGEGVDVRFDMGLLRAFPREAQP
ncbi:MAG: hypothetical protein ACO31E_02525 [Phycisphaerales bacterium]|jgi:hypothetical protein